MFELEVGQALAIILVGFLLLTVTLLAGFVAGRYVTRLRYRQQIRDLTNELETRCRDCPCAECDCGKCDADNEDEEEVGREH